MFKKIKKFFTIVKYYFTDEDNLFMYLLKAKAFECMNDCYKLDVSRTEELEDLVFHIDAYLSIPEALISINYPEFKNVKVRDIIKRYKSHNITLDEVKKYGNFLIDIEVQRNIERDFIFEHAKCLPFGFHL